MGAHLPGTPAAPAGLSPEFAAALAQLRAGRGTEAARVLAGAQTREIRSASVDALTSPHLADLRDALAVAQRQRNAVAAELHAWRPRVREQTQRVHAWEAGWLLRRLRPGRLAAMRAEAEENTARVAELDEQLRLSVLPTDVTMTDDAGALYDAVLAAFTRVAGAARVWDTTHSRATDRVRERTAATSTIKREPVHFDLAGPAVLPMGGRRVPHLGNANGGDLYLAPGLVLYQVDERTFAVVDAREVAVSFEPSRFIEQEAVPPDARRVGRTWEYVNKNGLPDRRFAHNPEYPVVEYGELTLRSPRGLHEVYTVSNADAARAFADAWRAYAAS